MKRLRNLLIGLMTLSAAAAEAEDQAIENDLAQLQGEWSMVSGSADGQAMPDEMLASAKRVCQGDQTTVTIGGQLLMKAKFTLDPSRKPKSIDYQILDGFTKGKTQLGIYEISGGDNVKFYFGSPDAERPGDFSSKAGDGRTYSVWKRKAKSGAQDVPKPAGPPAEGKASGLVAPDVKPEALWDGRKIVPFRALDSPRMVKAAEADFLDESDYVLGVSAGGESRAYPTRFIWWHHVINDTIGKPEDGAASPIAVTYCSVCNTGIRYDLRLKGEPIKLDFYGLYNGVVTLCDRATGSVLLQVDGRFVSGPLLGTNLKPGPLLDTTWCEWRTLHPDTLVMSPETPYAKFYSQKGKPELRGHERFPAPFFQPTMTRTDKRLPFFEKVLGVASPARTPAPPDLLRLRRAYPLSTLKQAGGVVNDSLGDAPVAAFIEPESMTATAFSRELDGKTLTFQARKQRDSNHAIFDKETGTRWDMEGHGCEGPLKGKSLAPLESHLSQWYGWVAYFPDTSIYGRSDPPQPELTRSEAPAGESPEQSGQRSK